jgi:5S rRNA maturation endonuclease (ribonuclease M5)
MVNVEATDRYPVGFGYCMGGCGPKTWNQIAEKLGLKKIKEGDDRPDTTRSVKFDNLREAVLPANGVGGSSLEQAMHSMGIGLATLNEERWRTIPKETLAKVGSLRGYDSLDSSEVLVLPVKVNGILYGVVKCALKKQKGQRSYVVSYGSWVKSWGLFPYDLAVEMALSSDMDLCIVEGPRDALKLISFGIPAVAMMGTTNWSRVKTNLILDSGVQGVVIVMDSDKSGEKARKMLNKQLRKKIKTRTFNLTKLAQELELDELDPATLSKKHLRLLKNSLTHD